MDEALLKAQLDFQPVPQRQRKTPGRVKSVPVRLRIDQYEEHERAYEFLKEVNNIHGLGSKTLVRALLHYRDTVVRPIESGSVRPTDPSVLISRLDFTPQRGRKGSRVKHASARLYIDKWIEHRQAYEFLQKQSEIHGEGAKTIVRALLHYRDTVYEKIIKAAG